MPFMFGNVTDGVCKLFFAGKVVFQFKINLLAYNDVCLGILRGVTDLEEAVIELLYVREGKVRYKFTIVKHYAWFVPVSKQTPEGAYEAIARVAAGDQWEQIDIRRPSYKWERKQN